MRPEDCISRYGIRAGDEVRDICIWNDMICELWSHDTCPEFENKEESER